MLGKDLTAATVRPAVLAILAEQESYGYEIIKKVADLSGERIQWAEGALYPLLHRLESEKLVESSWRSTDSGRRRKYYRLRASGRKELDQLRLQWAAATDLLGKLWGPKPCLT